LGYIERCKYCSRILLAVEISSVDGCDGRWRRELDGWRWPPARYRNGGKTIGERRKKRGTGARGGEEVKDHDEVETSKEI
jgi:hypothetical protein